MTRVLIATVALAGSMGTAFAQETPRPYDGAYEASVAGRHSAAAPRPATLRDFFARDVLGPNFLINDNHDYSGR